MTIEADDEAIGIRVHQTGDDEWVTLHIETPEAGGDIRLPLADAMALCDQLALRVSTCTSHSVGAALSCLDRATSREHDMRGLQTLYRLTCGAVAATLADMPTEQQLRRAASVTRLFSELADLIADRYE